jgi:hypothetical protein
MAHIILPSDSVRIRPRLPLSGMGVGLLLAGAVSAAVWAGVLYLIF